MHVADDDNRVPKMKLVTCFLTVVCCAVALPADVEHTPKVKTPDLPGGRMTGALELAPGSAPYQVALLVNGETLCSGVLIARMRILTTGTCMYSASYVEVRLGAHYYNRDEDTQIRVNSSSIIVHEAYRWYGVPFRNDIALIFLQSPTPLYNNNISVVPLAPADTQSYEGSWGFVSGWGKTSPDSSYMADGIRGANVNVMSVEACEELIGNGDELTGSNLCTSPIGLVSACEGDAGNPLVVDGVLIGILVTGSCQQEGSAYMRYTRISTYRSWIDQY